jgi:hypothetical protein
VKRRRGEEEKKPPALLDNFTSWQLHIFSSSPN